MAASVSTTVAPDWRQGLPTLVTPRLTLREPAPDDCGTLVHVLSAVDASRFGAQPDAVVTAATARDVVERAIRNRTAGHSVTYAITLTESSDLVGVVQVRQLDPVFEAAEWEMTLIPGVRGTGVFLETARSVVAFVFNTLRTHRLEVRVLPHNGRAIGALRKLGAVQEGILRRSLRQRGNYVDQVLWSILRDDWAIELVPPSQRVH
jgi:ribosomal-protein-alanine N-acetyltransferase